MPKSTAYLCTSLTDTSRCQGILNTKRSRKPNIPKRRAAGSFESIAIKFNVARSWLAENNAVETDVALSRFVSEWTELPTKIVGSDVDNIFYEAISPGFSFFAIVLKGELEEEAQIVEDVAEPEENVTISKPVEVVEEEKESRDFDIRSWLVVLAVFVSALLVLYYSKSKSKSKNKGQDYGKKIK